MPETRKFHQTQRGGPIGRPTAAPMAIVYRAIDTLKPDPSNPRRHSKKQVRQITDSIRIFGFNVPILIDREGRVIAGHGRLLAASELGMAEVPTLCLEHLSQSQARVFMIADNRLTEIATWDDRVLAEQLKELSLQGLDFSLEITGFEMGEIDLRIESLDKTPPESDDPIDAAPEVPIGPAVSRPGDLWLMDQHRLLCGDVLDVAAFRTLLGEQRAAMVFTDPPYNVPIDGHATGLGAIHHRSFAMAAGEMSRPAFEVFLATGVRHLAAFCVSGALLFVCMDWRHIGELLAAGREAEARLENLCVWVKDNAGMGSLYTAACTSWSLSSAPAAAGIATTSSSAVLAATGPMCGITPGLTRSPAKPRRAASWPCTRRSNRSRWSPMRSSTAPSAATSCWMALSAAARP
jgi:hypothetical protein